MRVSRGMEGLFALESAAAAPSPVMGNMPPNDGMPGGPMPPGFFQVRKKNFLADFIPPHPPPPPSPIAHARQPPPPLPYPSLSLSFCLLLLF
ncbi:single-stranded DNA-binding protein 3-like protein [Lates japonicus]|uniref:Single-stranded DNA-binding protein 3-like protein n=1 Tax=Lates japonicus TaxID=270547 RepID=A0AAD3RPH4_LATJO|nr:single-stranded DNA-binding protein 3-like protein [Lates japonicus]